MRFSNTIQSLDVHSLKSLNAHMQTNVGAFVPREFPQPLLAQQGLPDRALLSQLLRGQVLEREAEAVEGHDRGSLVALHSLIQGDNPAQRDA